MVDANRRRHHADRWNSNKVDGCGMLVPLKGGRSVAGIVHPPFVGRKNFPTEIYPPVN